MMPKSCLQLFCALLLAAAAVHAQEDETADLLEPFLGCWDDQFTGNADSTLLISDTELVVSYAAGSPPLTFTILPNYTTTFATGSDDWSGVSVIAANDPNDPWSGGKFSDFDMMHGTDVDGMEKIMYCQIDYDDPSAAEASKPEGPPEISYLNSTSGCNGYPFSVMTRSVGGKCKPDGTDDTTSAGAMSFVARNALNVFGLTAIGGLML